MKDFIKYSIVLLLAILCGIQMPAQDREVRPDDGIRDNIGTGKKRNYDLFKSENIVLHSYKEGAFPIIGYWFGAKEDSTNYESYLLSFNDDDKVMMSISLIERCDWDAEYVPFSLVIEADGRYEEQLEKIIVKIDTTTIHYDVNFITSGLEDNGEELMRECEKLSSRIKNNIAKKIETPLWLNKNRYNGTSYMYPDSIRLQKKYKTKTIKYGEIEGKKRYLAKSGLSGKYIILRWCDWDCNMYSWEFDYKFEKYRKKPQSIILLPFSSDCDGNYVFGDPVVMECPKGKLGIRIEESEIPYSVFFKEILPRYMIVK